MHFIHADLECGKKHEISKPGIVLFRKFDDRVIPYTGKADVADIMNFVKYLLVPEVFELEQMHS